MTIPKYVSMYKLDVGCGQGRWVKEESRSSRDFIIGVDKHAYTGWFERKRPNAQFIIADARHLPFKDRAFGYVLAGSMSELDAKGVSEAAGEMQRILKEGEVYFTVSGFSPEGERVGLWKKRDARLKEHRKSWLGG
jgi:ubiquinone/menaquinone biosynthesis C-methylase UbiE